MDENRKQDINKTTCAKDSASPDSLEQGISSATAKPAEQEDTSESTGEYTSLPLTAASETTPPDSADPDDDDDISLPLSAAREGYRRPRYSGNETNGKDAADSDDMDSEDEDSDDTDVSLPLSARREENDPGYSDTVNVVPPPPQPSYREIPQNNKITVRSLMECAMMVALSLVLAVIGFYVPVISVVGLILFPLPLAILVFRNGLKVGFIGAVALFALSAVAFGLPKAVIMIIEYGILGIFLGYCFRKNKSPLFSLGISIIIAACGTLAGIMLSLFVSGLPFSALIDSMTDFANDYFAMFANSGLDSLLPGNMTMDAFVQQMTEQMIKLIPAFLIIGSMVMAAVCYLVSGKILRHLNYNITKMPPFRDWRMDWRFSWGVIAGLAGLLAGRYWDISWLETLGMNILYVFCPVLLICGLAFVVWLFKQPIYSPFFKLLIIVMMIIFIQVTFFVLMVLAVFEPIVNFRGRIEKALEKLQRRS